MNYNTPEQSIYVSEMNITITKKGSTYNVWHEDQNIDCFTNYYDSFEDAVNLWVKEEREAQLTDA